MKHEIVEMTNEELAATVGGGEWAGIGYLWSGGAGAFGVVAGVAAAFSVAPALIGVAVIAGAAFAASSAMVLIMDSNDA